MAVVLYHLGGFGLTGGFGGVDVFFVISGYLITALIKREIETDTFSVPAFYERRIRRIFPALFLVMAATLALASLWLLPGDFKDFGSSLLGVVTLSSNFYFQRKTGYFDTAAEEKPLLHTWSLSVEEQFYLVFPVLLWALYRFCRPAVSKVLFAIAALSFAENAYALGETPAWAFFASPGRAWELLTGALAVYIPARNADTRFVRELKMTLGLALIIFGLFGYSDATPFPGPAALVFCVGAALIIHTGKSGPQTLAGQVLSTAPFKAIGLISYSLYLWHWPLLALAHYRFADLFADDGVAPLSVRLSLLGLSFVLAYLSWAWIEQPLRKRSGRRGQRMAYFCFAALSLLIGAVSVGVVKLKGFPERWPADVVAMLDDSVQRKSSGCEAIPAREGWPADACRLGPPDAVTGTLVWGDSHAQFLISELSAQANGAHRGVIVAAIGGCPPFEGVLLFGRAKIVACRSLGEKILKQIAAHPITHVILSARWAYYATGQRYGAESGQPVLLSPGSISNNPELFAKFFTRTVEKLVALGVRVTIIGSIPEQTFNVAPSLARHRLWQQSLPNPVSRADFDLRQAKVRPVLERLAQMPAVRVLYPEQRLCSAQVCDYTAGGWPLYTDSNHLSLKGLSLLEPLVAEALNAPKIH